MEQRLRLVQGVHPTRAEQRSAPRHALAVPGQIIWKDARGTTRTASVVTKDVSETGVRVEVLEGAAIPLYRMVYFQVDRSARGRKDLPGPLQEANVLSAVFRVGGCSPQTGVPIEYALRLLVEPRRTARTETTPDALTA